MITHTAHPSSTRAVHDPILTGWRMTLIERRNLVGTHVSIALLFIAMLLFHGLSKSTKLGDWIDFQIVGEFDDSSLRVGTAPGVTVNFSENPHWAMAFMAATVLFWITFVWAIVAAAQTRTFLAGGASRGTIFSYLQISAILLAAINTVTAFALLLFGHLWDRPDSVFTVTNVLIVFLAHLVFFEVGAFIGLMFVRWHWYVGVAVLVIGGYLFLNWLSKTNSFESIGGNFSALSVPLLGVAVAFGIAAYPVLKTTKMRR